MSATIATLERRRRWTVRGALIGLALPALGWPLALRFGEGSETSETIGGAVLLAGLIALFTVPFILGSWRRHMARSLLGALTSGRDDLRHVNGETQQRTAVLALGSPACDLGLFDGAGLVEPFATASIDDVLVGDAQGIPFTLAELRLYNEEGFEVFAGVVGGFRLQRSCPGLTLVTRERGLIGNLIASAGTGIERVGLEDPIFERRFEVYGTNQVWCRTVLTTTMLERLVRLDDLAHARGFRCAFVGDRLLLALSGMHWRAPLWRVVFPLEGWLEGFRRWLENLITLPAAVVGELALNRQVPTVLTQPAFARSHPWESIGAGGAVMRGKLSRLVAGIGMPAVYIASGTLFGGISLFFGYHIFLEWGVAASGGWKVAWPIPLGVLYGVFAIGFGLRLLARLAWSWNAPLRGLHRSSQ